MADKYGSFNDLSRNEREEADYRKVVKDRNSAVLIMAPHGGWIEPGTSEIVAAIAGDTLSLYAFEGLKPNRAHEDLHITSSKFDEPSAEALLAACETVVGIHGMKNRPDGCDVWVGGRDIELRNAIVDNLRTDRFVAIARNHGETFAGWEATNVCNRGRTRAGVQLEISRDLRDRLKADPKLMERFANEVRRAL